jgi:hypothetical protein
MRRKEYLFAVSLGFVHTSSTVVLHTNHIPVLYRRLVVIIAAAAVIQTTNTQPNCLAHYTQRGFFIQYIYKEDIVYTIKNKTVNYRNIY